MTPDPAGTQYAITQFTVANNNAFVAPLTVTLGASAQDSPVLHNDCEFLMTATSITKGPALVVPVFSTGALQYVQPFVIAAPVGAHVCLTATVNGHPEVAAPGLWSAVGYKIFPK